MDSIIYTAEDGYNIEAILRHHLALVGIDAHTQMQALRLDLLRYCTRLRNQPNTHAHRTVPAHRLIGDYT